jgi:hypothetical protein
MEKKYISFEPWWEGFSNVKISYELICAISIITDRIIILPPLIHCYFLNSAWDKKSYLNIWEILDKSKFVSNFNTADYYSIHEYRSMETEKSYFSNIENIAKVITFDGIIWKGPNKEIPENIVITNEIVNDSDLQKFLLGRSNFSIISEEKYIHFPRNLFGHFCYQVYGNTPSVRNLIKERIKNGIKFKEEFYERAKGIRNKIGPYNSIHVRRNDFVEVHCESTNDQSNNLIQYLDNKLGKDLPLYIATDEKNKLFFKDVSERYKIYFNEDLFNGIDNKESIAIDQIMCIESEKFLGSMFSTFTNSINIQRGYEGKDDFSRNGINFTYQELEYERFPWEIENYDWTKIDKYFWINENS